MAFSQFLSAFFDEMIDIPHRKNIKTNAGLGDSSHGQEKAGFSCHECNH